MAPHTRFPPASPSVAGGRGAEIPGSQSDGAPAPPPFWYARAMADKEVVTVARFFDHPIEVVFRRYTDHAGWSEWAGMGTVRLVRGGSKERDGTGSVRAFSAAPGLREEVTRFEPPARMEYRVVKGAFPLTDHLGEVMFEPEGSGTRITWRVSFRSKVPVVGPVLRRGLELVFNRVLKLLARDLDGRKS